MMSRRVIQKMGSLRVASNWALVFLMVGWLMLTCHAGPDFCNLPPERGNCSEKLYKYFFSPEEEACRLFVFGGFCEGDEEGEGNENRFDDRYSCMEICTGNYTDEDVRNGVIISSLNTAEEVEDTETGDDANSAEESSATEYPVSPFLMLENRTDATTFTFSTSSSFIRIEPNELTDYQLRNRRSVTLWFRTRLPHALLVFHGLRNRPASINKYELYVMLDQGQLKIKHKFGEFSTTLIVGKGLNRDQWHKVRVMIDPNERRIFATVDDVEKEMEIDGLVEHHLYGAYDVDLESIIFIGGLSAGDGGVDISYFANPLVGCMTNVILETSPLKTSALVPISPLVSSTHNNIGEYCNNLCWAPDLSCSRDSKCINHYDHVECDCFEAKFKGSTCKDPSDTVLTLNGYSYVTFTVYEWMDRVHSDANRISMRFVTQLDDSILFYAAGEIPFHNHVAVSVFNNSLLVDINFGNGQPIVAEFSRRVTDGQWHALTIVHDQRNITIYLDNQKVTHTLTGPNTYLYIDPDVYFGGGGLNLKNRNGLKSFNNFVGCLEEVYFNTKSILLELRENNHQAQHHGLMPPEFNNCDPTIKTIPITIPFADSGFRVSNPNPTELHLKFSFRTNETYGTLAYSDVRTMLGEGFWELKFSVNSIIFEYFADKSAPKYSTPTQFEVNYPKRPNFWHTIELQIQGGRVTLTVNGQKSEQEITHLQQLSAVITLGTSAYQPKMGFLGCIRRVEIGGKFIDARTIVGSDDQIGDIALDNCQFMDPCNRPDVCEHGGICKVIDSNVTCDCRDSGYTGKHCHFAIFKRTCEELALLGYTESGVYKIDIDGNGPYPPTHVKCKFETDDTGETKTIVEHNLMNETTIWGANRSDFSLELTYREFTSEMLLSLVSQSVQCSQHIKFDCYKAKIGLQQFTWFKSADPRAPKVVSIGDAKRNTCPCYEAGSCVNGEQCNCDSGEDKWLNDEGYFTIPDRLGITSLSFIYPRDSSTDSKARITLGPLECVEANTQRYVVTFKTFGSYLEAPGWKSGDLAFSFRTTRSSAILLYQPLIHQQHNSFSVFLTNDHELTFRFVLNGRPQSVTVRSQRSLSGGDWQQVWIDYDLHQVRFQINREHQMINLPEGQQFGPFEGIMYIAGAPARHLQEIDVKEGLIGCFRGLVMNGQVVDLYSFMKFHKADIVKDCSPSCDPNPCKNSAMCQENWGSFTCQCSNPWAHTGTLCETDINIDGLTFLSQSSYIKRQSLVAKVDPIQNILTSNIYLNLRTYDEDALVLYANDNLNNFVQLHIGAGNNVTFMWNDGHFIEQISVHQKRLNHGNPVQIAVLRNSTHTILHVNDNTGVAKSGVSLLKEYSENPWVNPILETFAPPRPFAPAAPYYQLFLGGFDNSAVKPINNTRSIPGMLGCLRGFKIGGDQIKISNMANQNDVLEGCKMVCDTKPCHNGGICMEDFQVRQYSCDCTFTSYYGTKCEDERGATFQGESYIRRRFNNPGETVPEIEARFGFSSNYNGEETVLLTVQIPGQNYSLLFAINAEGHLILMETFGIKAEGAKIKYQHFVDGSRHSVYYKRNSDETIFIVDQEEIHISSLVINPPKFQLIPNQNLNVGEIFVGGVNEAVPDLINLNRFKGCLSNIYVEINKLELRPMDEYMGYVKKPADQLLDMENVEGIKASTCGAFFASKPAAIIAPKGLSPPENGESDWRISGPKKTNLDLGKSDEPDKAAISFDMVALILAVFLGILVLSVLIYAYKLDKRYKRRKYLEDDDDDDLYFSHRGQNVRYHDPSNTELKYVGYRPTDPDQVNGNNSKSGVVNRTNGEIPVLGAEAEEQLLQNDGDGEGSDTTSQNESEAGSHQSGGSSVSDSQNLDDKEVDEDPSGSSSPQSPTALGDLSLITEEDEVSNDKLKNDPSSFNNANSSNFRPNKGAISPVFVSDACRTFETSPIAIIGGARYQNLKRTSKDSILSLD